MLFNKPVNSMFAESGDVPGSKLASQQDTVSFHGRDLAVRLTRAAEKALHERQSPLKVELELFFSCLIRKRVRFPEGDGNGQGYQPAAGGRLQFRFRPVMTQQCSVTEEPELAPFPIADPGPFVPHWVQIDYRPGVGWEGEFGFASGAG